MNLWYIMFNFINLFYIVYFVLVGKGLCDGVSHEILSSLRKEARVVQAVPTPLELLAVW